jgi:hypothetical protein
MKDSSDLKKLVTFYFNFIEWQTNAQIIDKLLYCSYILQHYGVIVREFAVSTL